VGQQLIGYVLVLFRVGGIMIFAPFFGSGLIPGRLKAALSMVIALALVSATAPQIPAEITYGYILKAAAGESAVGLLLGYAASLVFVGVQLAGMQIGQQMGTGIANIFNPLIEDQIALVGQFYFFFAVFVYLGIGGHHLLLKALAASFTTLPAGWMALSARNLDIVITLFAQFFAVAFAVSAPIVLALFLTTVAMGFVARTVPQMNILVIGFPIRMIVGLTVMAFTLPSIGSFIARTITAVLGGLGYLTGGGP
jgi:flagellar biosynthetic protein FliR